MKCILLLLCLILTTVSAIITSKGNQTICDDILYLNTHYFTCYNENILYSVFVRKTEGELLSPSRLYLNNKNISWIMPDAFANLKVNELILELAPEKLELAPESFNGLPNLTSLKFKSGIVPLKPSLFRPLCNTLTSLELIIDPLNDNFHNVLQGHGKKLQNLIISNSDLKYINVNTFFSIHWNITRLELSRNKLISIGADTFSSIKTLEHLIISSNGEIDLRLNSFIGLDKLKSLLITDNFLLTRSNNLTPFRHNVFNGLKQLKILNLTNNRINYIDQHTFSGLLNLEELHLNDNLLYTLFFGCFNSLKKLKKLSLENNKITEIGGRTFAGLNLEELTLYKNDLYVIEHQAFGNLSTKNLYLLNNPIMSVKQGAFRGSKIEWIDIMNLTNNNDLGKNIWELALMGGK